MVQSASFLAEKKQSSAGQICVQSQGNNADKFPKTQTFIFNNYNFFALIYTVLMLIFEYKTFFHNIKLI
jgi:hypothetical protein